MDIGLHSKVKFYSGYTYYFQPKKHPDQVLMDWLRGQGEFSLSIELARERELKCLTKAKFNYDYSNIPIPKGK